MNKSQAKRKAEDIFANKIQDILDYWTENERGLNPESVELINIEIRKYANRFFKALGFETDERYILFQKIGKTKKTLSPELPLKEAKRLLAKTKKFHPNVKLGYKKV